MSDEILDHARQLALPDDAPAPDSRTRRRQEKDLRRQIYVCGYKLKHFLSLRAFYMKQLEKHRAAKGAESDEEEGEDEDIEMVDDEVEIITVRLISMFRLHQF